MTVVSVIVPTLNEAANIARCVRSVLEQREVVGEILVVDCGSTDGMPGIVEGLARQDPSVRLLRSNDRSYAAAVSLGVERAIGEYVQLVDGDSVLEEGWLRRGLDHLGEHDCGAVRGLLSLENDSSFGEFRRSNKEKVDLAFGGPTLFRAEVIKRFNYDPEIRRSSDIDVYLRMKAAGYDRCLLKEPMLAKNDADNAAMNPRKILDQGFYSGLMLAKNSSSPGYVELFLRLRRSYLLLAAYLGVGVVGWLSMPRRLMLVYTAAPFLARVLRGGGLKGGSLWYLDRLLRGGAFTVALLGRPASLVRVARAAFGLAVGRSRGKST